MIDNGLLHQQLAVEVTRNLQCVSQRIVIRRACDADAGTKVGWFHEHGKLKVLLGITKAVIR